MWKLAVVGGRPGTVWIGFGGVLLLILIGAAVFSALGIPTPRQGATAKAPGPDPGATRSVTRHFRYGVTLHNTRSSRATDVRLWLRSPLDETSTQRRVNLQASHRYTQERDTLGNQTLRFELDPIAPLGTVIINVRGSVEILARPSPGAIETTRSFLGAEPLVEAGAPALVQAVAKLPGQGRILARHLTDWAAGQLKNTPYRRRPIGALAALAAGSGDCTEFMHLVVAAARTRGIPARCLGGYRVEGDGLLAPSRYHNWAELFVDGAWRLADPSHRRFDQEYEAYLAMRVSCPGQAQTIAGSERFWYNGDGLEVFMHNK